MQVRELPEEPSDQGMYCLKIGISQQIGKKSHTKINILDGPKCSIGMLDYQSSR